MTSTTSATKSTTKPGTLTFLIPQPTFEMVDNRLTVTLPSLSLQFSGMSSEEMIKHMNYFLTGWRALCKTVNPLVRRGYCQVRKELEKDSSSRT